MVGVRWEMVRRRGAARVSDTLVRDGCGSVQKFQDTFREP